MTCAPGTVPVAQPHLASAIEELVENACRFSKPGQPVAVIGRVEAGRYLLEVIDHGAGMTAEQCAQVAPFMQFDRARHNQQGLGLGLAIARATAELAHGQLRLTPGRPDQPGLQATLDVALA